jgi:hypothetical protein
VRLAYLYLFSATEQKFRPADPVKVLPTLVAVHTALQLSGCLVPAKNFEFRAHFLYTLATQCRPTYHPRCCFLNLKNIPFELTINVVIHRFEAEKRLCQLYVRQSLHCGLETSRADEFAASDV